MQHGQTAASNIYDILNAMENSFVNMQITYLILNKKKRLQAVKPFKFVYWFLNVKYITA